MSKYTDAQLKDMAQQVIDDHKAGGERSFMLVMTLSINCNIHPADVWKRIDYFANKEV